VVLNQLYKHTQLQTNFSVNMLAIDAGRPQVMGVKDVLAAFCAFREEVVRKRTGHELEQARARAHVLAGLALAVANLDRMIALIRGAKDPDAARAEMLAIAWPAGDVAPLITLIDEPGHRIGADGTYKLSETQARAILELRLQRLTGLERDKIAEELDGLVKQIGEYVAILESREKRIAIVRAELLEVRAEFATPRRTSIEESEAEVDIEDLIAREDMVVTVTLGGYIKRQPLSAYRLQNRGGKGRTAMGTKDEDVLTQVYVVNTHTPVLFFSSRGMVYKLKVFRLPLGNPQSRGKAMVNLLPLQAGETITTVMPMPEDEASWAQLHVMFATQGGTIRRNALSDFVSVMANGKIAMKLEDEEGKSVGRLIGVQTCREDQDVLIATRDGKAIRFAVADVRVFSGRSSVGVRAIRLAGGDEVISLSILDGVVADTTEREAYIRMAAAKRRAASGEAGAGEAGAGEAGAGDAGADEPAPAEEGEAGAGVTLDAVRFAALEEREQFVLTVTDKGFGKRTSAYEYRATGRGGQGIAGIELSDKNGMVVGSFPVRATDQLMLVTDKGQIIRCPVGQVRIAGRRTQGVLLFRVAAEERVVSVARMGEVVAAEDGDAGDAARDEAGGEPSGSPAPSVT
ncbi:MAG: DNA gyrase subunit A, partial [Alphaproteobacteria bacterium]|nr:DNA gyrase subunit A [Alphaproteobacteria bacterium]